MTLGKLDFLLGKEPSICVFKKIFFRDRMTYSVISVNAINLSRKRRSDTSTFNRKLPFGWHILERKSTGWKAKFGDVLEG
jgi:hypothetical protein